MVAPFLPPDKGKLLLDSSRLGSGTDQKKHDLGLHTVGRGRMNERDLERATAAAKKTEGSIKKSRSGASIPLLITKTHVRIYERGTGDKQRRPRL